jgi:hypothetical protein
MSVLTWSNRVGPTKKPSPSASGQDAASVDDQRGARASPAST